MANSMWGNNKIDDKCRFKITSASTHWAYGVKISSVKPNNLLSMEVKAYQSSSQEIHM